MPSDQGGMVEAKSQPSILNKDSSLGFPIAGCDVSSHIVTIVIIVKIRENFIRWGEQMIA